LPQSTTHQKKSFIVLLVALGLGFLFLIRPFLIPIVLAAILVVLTYPGYAFLLKVFRKKSYISSFVATLLLFLVLILPTGLILTLLVNQGVELISQINLDRPLAWLNSSATLQNYLIPLTDFLEKRLGLQIDLPSIIIQGARQALHYVYSFSPAVLTTTTSFVFKFLVMHFSIFFLFVEGPSIIRVVMDLSPLKEGYEKRLVNESKKTVQATVYGYLVTALIQAILAGLGFWLAGFPAPLIFATLTYVMAMVPLVGTAAVWVPAVIWLFSTGKMGWGVFMSIYGFIIISGIDNIVKPLIIQGRTKIHPLIIFFSLFGGIQLFGPIGILLGPVLTALFFACIRIYREDFLTKTKV